MIMNSYLLRKVKEQGIVLIINNMMKDIDYTNHILHMIDLTNKLFLCCSGYCVWEKGGKVKNPEYHLDFDFINYSVNKMILDELLNDNISNILKVETKLYLHDKDSFTHHQLEITFFFKGKREISFHFNRFPVDGTDPDLDEKLELWKHHTFIQIFKSLK
jgi:hypothetical protein